jgi:hypothetical protein
MVVSSEIVPVRVAGFDMYDTMISKKHSSQDKRYDKLFKKDLTVELSNDKVYRKVTELVDQDGFLVAIFDNVHTGVLPGNEEFEILASHISQLV